MKLRAKIQLCFGLTIVIALCLSGAFSYKANTDQAKSDMITSVQNTASLSAGQIGSLLDTYKRMATVAGKNNIIGSKDIGSAEKMELAEQFAEEYGLTSANILDSKGISLKDGTDFSDREYVQRALAGETNISNVTLSKYTNTYGFSIAAPVYENGNGAICGVIYFRADIDFMLEIIGNIIVSDSSYAFIVDENGTVIVHADQSQINVNNLVEQGGNTALAVQDGFAGNIGTTEIEWQGEKEIMGYAPISNTDGWVLLVDSPEKDYIASCQKVVNVLFLEDIIWIIIAVIVSWILSSYIAKSVRRVQEMLVSISEGDFSMEVEKSNKKDEIAILNNAAISLRDTMRTIIGEANEVLGAMANFDLAIKDMEEYPGEFNQFSESVNSIKGTQTMLMRQIKEMADSVGVGSSELAAASAALSQGTLIQAESISKVVMEVDNIADGIQSNSHNEHLVNDKLQNLDAQIKRNNSEMTELMNVVKKIGDMSNDIQKIVGTIDSIAFQTNILALNASVEAARAGDLGKGFAVVADEVGSLAGKCGEASKKTSELIERCIVEINNALECAENTFDGLKIIVENSEEIAVAFNQIAEDTKEQAEKSENIKEEINNISDVVQTNTATAEETAASTETLSEQAEDLRGIVDKFRL